MSAEVQCVKQSIRFFRLLFHLPSSPGCEAKGDTLLLTFEASEAGLLKRLEFKPGDGAEKTSFNLIRKTDFLPMKGSHVCIGLCDAKGTANLPRTIYDYD